MVGAEEVLARMVHERQVSHLFTPVRLGEIISTRHFTPSKQVNPWAKGAEDRAERLSLGNDGQFVKQQQAIPAPQRMLTVLDAFDSIRWAMTFARWGQERQINTLIEFFANLTRDHPNKIPQIREYYKNRKLPGTLQCTCVQEELSGRVLIRSCSRLKSMMRWRVGFLQISPKAKVRREKDSREVTRIWGRISGLCAEHSAGGPACSRALGPPHRATSAMIGGDSPCVLALCGQEAAFPPVPPNPAPFCPKLPEPVLQAGLAPLAPPAEADPNPNHVSPTPVTLSALTTLSPTVPGNLRKPVEVPDVNHGQRVLPERTVMDMECPEPMRKDVQGTPQQPVPKSPCPQTSGKLQASVPESQKMPNTCGVRPVALLSCFDGIATARQALVDLKIKPIVSWSWETDEACRKVVKARRPDIVQFGDALATSPEEVIARLQSSCPANTLVLVCAAPPCLDFTIMKGSAAADVRGQEGNK